MAPAVPTQEERRTAVCQALAASPRLVRYAARITRNVDDAEDAYQRAMEIALRSAPVVDADRFMAWLRTVLRNEALTIAQRRRRESPAFAEDAALLADRGAGGNEGVEEWRHRYLIVVDAFTRLSDAQRICLILQARGASYDEIETATGFSRRKVERAILEGRAALRTWEQQIDSGDACARVRVCLDAVVAGDADRRDRVRVDRHVRHCGHCRALLRQRRHRARAMGALAPTCLMPGVVDVTPADPGPVLAWLDRASLSGTVRAGNALQMLLEAPGSLMVKAGAGVAATAVAIGLGAPLLSLGPPPPAGRDQVPVLAQARAAADTARPPVRTAMPAPPATPAGRDVPRALVATPRVAAADLARVAALARTPVRAARVPAPASAAGASATPSPAAASFARSPVSAPAARSHADAAGAASISIGPVGP